MNAGAVEFTKIHPIQCQVVSNRNNYEGEPRVLNDNNKRRSMIIEINTQMLENDEVIEEDSVELNQAYTMGSMVEGHKNLVDVELENDEAIEEDSVELNQAYTIGSMVEGNKNLVDVELENDEIIIEDENSEIITAGQQESENAENIADIHTIQ